MSPPRKPEIGEGAPAVISCESFTTIQASLKLRWPRARSASAVARKERGASICRHRPQHSFLISGYLRLRKAATETTRLVAEALNFPEWDLVYQSRSGPPHQPWLGPDILDHLKNLHGREFKNVIVAPLGFISDHLEVLFDLDTEAKDSRATSSG